MPNEALLQHLRSHQCLPFPAGPIVPRRYTLPDASPLDIIRQAWRAKVGMTLLDAEFIRVQNGAQRSALTRQVQQAFLEWTTRHPGMASRTKADPDQPELQMLEALKRLADWKASDGTGPEAYRANLALRLARNKRASDSTQLPFRAPIYACLCCQAEPAPTSTAPRPVASDFVNAVLEERGGDGVLLALFFLRQLHSHLAWVPASSKHADAVTQFYTPIRNILLTLASKNQPGHFSATAATLYRSCARLNPYFCGTKDGHILPAERPACFWPDLLDDQANSLEQVRALLAGHGEMADMAVEADALALEVAARLTDPVLAAESGLDQAAFKYLAEALRKHGASARSVQFLDKDFVADHLKPRLKRLMSYANWMHDLDGSRVAATALKAIRT